MFGIVELAFILGIVVGALIVPMVGLVHAARIDEVDWKAIDQNKAIWLVVMLATGLVGVGVYWFMIRPKLSAARVEREMALTGVGHHQALR